MAMRFDGRVAIVTGAGGGLGREHALALAKRGAKVVVNDLGGARDGSGGSATAAGAVVAEIEAAGGEAMANAASVTDFAAVQAMVDAAMAQWGRVDILVNNAGVLLFKTLQTTEKAEFERIININLVGTFLGLRIVGAELRAQGHGSIVNISSVDGMKAANGLGAYCASKWAVRGFTKVAALEELRAGRTPTIRQTRLVLSGGKGLPLRSKVVPGLKILMDTFIVSETW